MKQFLHVSDIGDLKAALQEAAALKANPFGFEKLGEHKTVILVFFNSSLRTRLSSQVAAQKLGLHPIVLNVGADSWKLETELGVVMDGDSSEHLREAIPVIGSYCDLIGVRSFARFENRDFDYSETIINQFIQYSGKPVISLESATVHPCQALADLITINEHYPLFEGRRPKVVLSWAPHPRVLPQAVPNSFAEWMNAAPVDFVIACPEGYELAPQFAGSARVEHDQMKAFEGADFVYAKNWSSYRNYGQNPLKDPSWTVSDRQMAVTNNAYFMHCLPVRRNVVVSDSVIDGPRSLVIPEAANRVVAAQLAMKRILESL